MMERFHDGPLMELFHGIHAANAQGLQGKWVGKKRERGNSTRYYCPWNDDIVPLIPDPSEDLLKKSRRRTIKQSSSPGPWLRRQRKRGDDMLRKIRIRQWTARLKLRPAKRHVPQQPAPLLPAQLLGCHVLRFSLQADFPTPH